VFVWRYLGPNGAETGSSSPFPDQGAAETWLGDEWRALSDHGVDSVELVEDGEIVYRMSLGPPDG